MVSWHVKPRALPVLLVGLVLAVACGSGQVMQDSETVQLAGAQFVRTDVTMGAGSVKITGGAPALMNADFTYNLSDWRPTVKYDVSDGEGRLIVEQPLSPEIRLGNVRYEWDIRLSDNVPMELNVKLGAGDSQLTLGGLDLLVLDLEMGAGSASVDLTGTWDHDAQAHVRGGVGEATVLLPKQPGVRVTVQGGPGRLTALGLHTQGGAYVNDAYGTSDVTLEVDIIGGVGSVDLQVEQ
jgi:hypothetical protein